MRSSWAASGASCDCNPLSPAVAYHETQSAEGNQPKNQSGLPAQQALRPRFGYSAMDYARTVPIRRDGKLDSAGSACKTGTRPPSAGTIASRTVLNRRVPTPLCRCPRRNGPVCRQGPSTSGSIPANRQKARRLPNRRQNGAGDQPGRLRSPYGPTVVRQGNSRRRSLSMRALGCSDPMTTARDAFSRGASASFQPACSSSISALLNSRPYR